MIGTYFTREGRLRDLNAKPEVFELHSINCRKSLKVSEQCGNINAILQRGCGVY